MIELKSKLGASNGDAPTAAVTSTETTGPTSSTEMQAELQRLREKNIELQTQLDLVLRRQQSPACATSLDSALDLRERSRSIGSRLRGSSLDGKANTKNNGLHHRHVSKEIKDRDAYVPPRLSPQRPVKSKVSDIEVTHATKSSTGHAARTPSRSPSRVDQRTAAGKESASSQQETKFDNECNTNAPSPGKKPWRGTKRAGDGGARYHKTLDHDVEGQLFARDIHVQRGTSDDEFADDGGSESDDLIDDDSSHNKHVPPPGHEHGRVPTSPCSSTASFEMRNNFPPFSDQLKDRAGWLIGLLFLQSCSSFIIAYNEKFLQNHMVIVQFLTMLVGAGGNAGNQAAVGVIRALAIGTLNRRTQKPFLWREAKMALCLSALIGVTGFIRAILFRTPMGETIAITASVCCIVAISVAIGCTLPLGMKKVGIDPAHSSTSIQVIMDIMGVLITVLISSFVLSFEVFQHDDAVGGGDDDNL